MSGKVIYLASMTNLLNLEVCKIYSIRKAWKVSLFRNFVLAVFLSVVGYVFTAMPAAYAEGGYALEFNAGGYVELPDTYIKGLGRFSLSVWVYPTGTGSWEGIYMEDQYGGGPHGFGIVSSQGNTLRVYIATDVGTGSSTIQGGITLNTWQHIAVSYDGSMVRVYKNGDLLDSASFTGVFVADGTRARIGDYADSTSGPFEGRIDEVRVWNIARTQSEIQEEMYRELVGNEEGLVGYWKFNEGEGTTAYDSSPNKNDGTIVGASWTTDDAPVAPGLPPAFASRPSPANEATDVPPDVVLVWRPGGYAATHDVYFGTVFDDVNDASRANPLGVLASQNQSADTYDSVGLLEFGQTYYWRVDEVNNVNPESPWTGHVWSFTTEPVAYAIAGENITATASSAHAADMGPENTVNNSGLDANDLHSNEETDMWLSGLEPLGAWIEYELDKVYKLHQMLVWNSNQTIEPLIGFGFKDVTIEYSTNGTDYATLGTTHQFAQAPGVSGYAHNTTIDFGGVAAKYVRLTANGNWGGIMPQYGLSEVRLFYIPVRAREPSPTDGQTDVYIGTIDAPIDVTLSFRAGREAAKHNIYVSTDEQAVIDGTAAVATVIEASYGPLSSDLGQTYYWRVDEVNEAETPATWQGDLWNFTVREYFVVDDIESYNDLDTTDPESRRIFNVWIDGYETQTNGSLVGYENPPFCERTIVHGGKQSMPFFYANTAGAAYSEAELPLSPPQDWTKYAVKTLSLWFFGDASNTAAQLYVKLNGSKVMYDGDAANLTRAEWQVWNIDLASFGIDLQNITKLGIGIDGNGASGKLYFDDIRLYGQAPQPEAP